MLFSLQLLFTLCYVILNNFLFLVLRHNKFRESERALFSLHCEFIIN